MDVIDYRRLKIDFLVAILEMLVVLGAGTLVAVVTGRYDLLGVTVSASFSQGAVLVVLWYFAGRGALRWFHPEIMPATQAALVASRFLGGALPETTSDAARLAVGLLCPLLVGGAMGFVLSRPAVRRTARAIVESWG